MRQILTSPYEMMGTYLGLREVPGAASDPIILGWLKRWNPWATGDDVKWCSAAVAAVTAPLGLPHSKSLRARSWLLVGEPVALADAEPGLDVVVLRRGGGPGPEVIEAPGHVGLFGRLDSAGKMVEVRGGNQSDAVSDAWFWASDVLGVRRLA